MLMLKRIALIVPTVAMAGVLAIAGCQQTASTAKMPGEPMSYEALRATVIERNPNANVGFVSAALPDGKFAAVSGMPVEQFKKGDVVTFVDATTAPLANGTVSAISGDVLHVEVEQTVTGGRQVQQGDFAVRFKQQ